MVDKLEVRKFGEDRRSRMMKAEANSKEEWEESCKQLRGCERRE